MDIGNLLIKFALTLEEVLTLHQAKIKMMTKNIVLDRLRNYQRIFNKKEVAMLEHSEYFLAPFKAHRVKILSTKSDDWLKDSEVSIKWLDGDKSFSPKFSICLTIIYARALELKNKFVAVGKSMSAMGMSAEKMFPEILLPDKILAQYYGIVEWFLSHDSIGEELVTVSEDVTKLRTLITKYRQAAMMDLPPASETDGKQEGNAPTAAAATQANNPFANLDIASMFSKLTSTPAVAGLIDSMKKSAEAKVPPTQAIGSVVQKMADPKFLKEVGNSFGVQLPDEGLQSLTSIVDVVKQATASMGETLTKDIASVAAANPSVVVADDTPIPERSIEKSNGQERSSGHEKSVDLIKLKDDDTF